MLLSSVLEGPVLDQFDWWQICLLFRVAKVIAVRFRVDEALHLAHK